MNAPAAGGGGGGGRGARAAVRARITGRVQGVWFRGWTVQQAHALGLDGWVRNNADGSVELLAAGAPDAVETLLKACAKGPPSANVTAVERAAAADADDAPAPGTGFSQQR